MKYFTNCHTAEELKSEYRKLAMKHHPDRGGSEDIMKEINKEYDELFPRLKNIHTNKEGKTYEKETDEAPDYFKDLISALMKMQGVTVEVIGCFVWLSGNTKAHKEELKKLGFTWHKAKAMWYKAPAGYRKYNKAQYNMDEIRNMYGVQYEATANGTTKEERTEEERKYIA